MLDFCGIGNACVDIIAHVDDDFLNQWNFPKSICTYLDLETAGALDAALTDPFYIPGGCAANTAAGIAALGGKAALIGRVANDSIGAMFMNDLKERGIRYHGVPDSRKDVGSTRIYTFITPDRERTFAAFYGVQEDLSETDLDIDAIQKSAFLYLDGYALNAARGLQTFLRAIEVSKKAGHKTVFAPSDLSILTKYESAVDEIVRQTDVILCNEKEALQLTGTGTREEAMAALREGFTGGAVTIGMGGAMVFDVNGEYHAPAATPPDIIVDTNGAGDQFAAGFLYGLSHWYTLERAARLGNSCAAAIITRTGARPGPDFKQLVTQN